MEDFVIITIKNFSHTQNYRIARIWEALYFLVCLFFAIHMYNSKLVTNSLIIVGAHLTKKKKDIILLGAMIDLIHSL